MLFGQFNVVSQFEYLGIKILPDLKQFVEINHNLINTDLNNSIKSWMPLPLSLIGGINILKMKVLQNLLCVFQNVPLPLPPVFFFFSNQKDVHTVYME